MKNVFLFCFLLLGSFLMVRSTPCKAARVPRPCGLSRMLPKFCGAPKPLLDTCPIKKILPAPCDSPLPRYEAPRYEAPRYERYVPASILNEECGCE